MKKQINILLILLVISIPIVAQNNNMIFVKGASYKMGDMTGKGKDNERPVHEVTINSFFVSKFQVTVGDFKDFISETRYITDCEKKKGGMIWLVENRKQKYYFDSTANWRNVGYVPKDNQPVTFVSWNDAVAFCNWKSKKDKLTPCYKIIGDSVVWDKSAKGYRLLTEAEWEYMARSGDKEYQFSWGNDSLPFINGKKAANIKDETCQSALDKDLHVWKGYEDGFVYTSPVGSFAPNEIGVYDICGNVYEWCWDWFDDNYYKISSQDNPDGPLKGKKRVCRNVGYCCPIYWIAISRRGLGETNGYGENMGFRIGLNK